MEMLSLEEEATMSEPFYSREYDDPGGWDSEPPEWYPDDDDEGWPYPDSDNPAEGIPSVPMFRYIDDELYDRITDDDPVETDDPDDMKGWR